MPNAGDPLQTLDYPPTASDAQSAAGTATSTASYVEALAGGGVSCGVAFTAPTSGRVFVVNTADLFNNGANFTRMSFTMRTGSTIGSGTLVQAAGDSTCLLNIGTSNDRKSLVELVSGLTPGNPYNVRQAFRVSAGTGTYQGKTLHVFPAP